MIFKKKKKKENDIVSGKNLLEELSPNEIDNLLDKGMVTEIDLCMPGGIDRTDPGYLRMDDKYVKSLVVTGYPKHVYVSCFDQLIHARDYDLDLSILVEPTDEISAIDELTRKIDQFETQLSIETKKGNRKNITRLSDMVEELMIERQKIEQNSGGLSYTQITCNLFCDSKDELEKQAKSLARSVSQNRINLKSAFLQQDVTFKNVLPFGKNYLKDGRRNFSTNALTSIFPFYNNEISHKTGVFMGENIFTNTPMYIDLFDRKVLVNGNMTIFGKSGIGKTYFTELYIMRSIMSNISVLIIDPEGEFRKLAKNLGGGVVVISPNSRYMVNPFDIEDEEILDDDGNPTGKKVVRIKDKISDLINLIAIMLDGLTKKQESFVSTAISRVYDNFGITEKSESLYTEDTLVDTTTNVILQGGILKTMPRFTDFWNELNKINESTPDNELQDMLTALLMYKEGGAYDMFDCYTSKELVNLKELPIISFDLSQIEDEILRPLGIYITFSWAWEKFCKKRPYVKKLLCIDEAWMMTNKNMPGYKYSAKYLEIAARRIRKRTGALVIASQHIGEFISCPEGEAVVKNTEVNVFFRQEEDEVKTLKERFNLSEGEANFMRTSDRGEYLIRMNGKSTKGRARAFDFEEDLIVKKPVEEGLI